MRLNGKVAVVTGAGSGFGEAIANGGRYDDIGEGFGRARAATGFNADLKTLLALGKREFTAAKKIYAPAGTDAALQQAIAELRAAGDSVVQAFAGQSEAASEMGCDHELVKKGGKWQVKPL